MKVALDVDGLDRNPHNIAPDAWYYETKGGLEIIHKGRLVCIIRWRSLGTSLKRYLANRLRRKP